MNIIVLDVLVVALLVSVFFLAWGIHLWQRRYNEMHTARLAVEQELLTTQDRVQHLEHEYNPDIVDARTMEYVKVLDAVRQNINLDVRMVAPAGVQMLGGKPWGGPGSGLVGGSQSLDALARGGQAGVVDLNRRVERVHSAMKQLAEYFGEEDPCPCARCSVSREMKATGARTMSDVMRLGGIPKFPGAPENSEGGEDELPPQSPASPSKFDLPTPIDPDKMGGV